MTSSNVYLQLGDIIQIQAPTNPELNENLFLIQYIDSRLSILVFYYNINEIKFEYSDIYKQFH